MTGPMIQGGIWKLTLTPKQLVDGRFDFWMPSGAQINEETGFLVSESALTLTIPSTARRPITVAAYDANTDTYAALFRAAGYVCCNRSKPDLAAPGVDILSCAPGGGYTRKSGTSMACPFVTGKRRPLNAVWDNQWKRFIPIRSESKSLSHPRR